MDLKLLRVLLFVMFKIVSSKIQNDTARDQIILFKEKTLGPVAIMTTAAGKPIDYRSTRTLNERLLFNEFFMDSITHLNRERIPERFVHAHAGGAFGYFEVTHDVTDICKADFLDKVGKKTPIAARFSPIVIERGGMDTTRDARGFAIKFYTEEGNFDIVGMNVPVFGLRDPAFFPSFVRVQKRNPATNLRDPNMLWDFLTLRPENLHMFLFVFGDHGIPKSYRHMPGFSIHTYQVVNKHGDIHFVRFHFIPDQKIRFLHSDEARRIGAVDPDYNTRDLYRAIGEGNFPSWTASIQVLTLDDVKTAEFDIFDVTKELPLDKYPRRPIGRFVLNKNPVNYFAEIEQLAFNPANLVPGILGAPDKIFESRRLAYRDTQYYRLGANFLKIPVNSPLRNEAFPYNRDGTPPVKDNMNDIPNYYPNSFNGPVPYVEKEKVDLIEIYEDEPDNFDQDRDLYNQMLPDARKRLIENIVYSLGPVTKFIQERAIKIFALIHPDLSERIWVGLQANRTSCDFDY